ncbi:hypothetical protein J1N35_033374 [Gossypium stocksii]|uniref:Uncharacterized protein n=1 Tax=Gossypium stocksii TaxID=47602 RepID=A0A9D3URX0_9ROSI|nr:hypothetical protein J1N35_033374 [Gossypium stocksii]
MGDNLAAANNFKKMDILILIKQAYNIDELIMLEVGNKLFPIRIKESGLEEKTKDIQKNGDQMVREEDVSSEVGLSNKSELEMSPEGR